MSPARVWVVGVPGSGKSTFAGDLARVLGGRHVQLDSMFWLPDWKIQEADVFAREVESALGDDTWVVDGAFPVAVDGFIERSTCVVWLDPPLWRSWTRLVKRTLGRLVSGEQICGGNRESAASVFGSHSILWYALKIHREQRATNEALFAALDHPPRVLVRARTADTRKLARRLAEILRSGDLGPARRSWSL